MFFLSSLVPAFHIYFFIKQFKCCGLVDGASDWGQNFQPNSESCECSDTSDSPCTIYDGKYVYQQVRTNQTCHSKWFCSFFFQNERLHKNLNYSIYNGNHDINVPGISQIKKKSLFKDKSQYKR